WMKHGSFGLPGGPAGIPRACSPPNLAAMDYSGEGILVPPSDRGCQLPSEQSEYDRDLPLTAVRFWRSLMALRALAAPGGGQNASSVMRWGLAEVSPCASHPIGRVSERTRRSMS